MDSAGFVRYFYGGIGYVYYFVADQDPNAIRVLRVCGFGRETCTSEFAALYEEVLTCHGSTTVTTGVCGVHLLESFAGQTGPLVVVTQCDDGAGDTRNRACAFLLSDIDQDMDNIYARCQSRMRSDTDLPWNRPRLCVQFNVRLCFSS